MFQMNRIGRTIAEARRKKDMTQMELADKMNVSFQAVSNWERGISMPDISKLPELSELLEISVDALLGKESKLLHQVLANETAGEDILENAEITAQNVEEILEVVPILKPRQLDQIVKDSKNRLDMKDMGGLIPFLGTDICRELFEKCIDQEDEEGAAHIAPFVDSETVEKGVCTFMEKGKNCNGLFPFVSSQTADRIAWEEYTEQGMQGKNMIYPFCSQKLLQKIARTEYEKNGLKDFSRIAPFLDRAFLDELAAGAIERDGISAISRIAPFLSKEMLANYVREKYL